MVSDLWFTMAIIMPWWIVAMIPLFIFRLEVIDGQGIFSTSLLIPLIAWLILLFLILNKDCVNGMSAGKRTFGYRIIDYKSKEEATDFQCMIRNITMYIWPLEAIMVLINPNRRIGDFIAKTEVIKTDKRDINSLIFELREKNNLSGKQIVTSIVVAVLLTLIAALPLI